MSNKSFISHPLRVDFGRLRQSVASLHPRRLCTVDWLIGLWILGMISLPVLLWTIGDDALPWSISVNVIILASGMTLTLWQAWGATKTIQAVALVIAFAWLLEFVGSSTGFPFGVYDYSGRFQPQLGHVPLIIPFAWLMMLPPAWAVGQVLSGSGDRKRKLLFYVISAAAFTAWDFFLDPQMVAWGMWIWLEPGGYFGIPWQNFVGWFLGALLLSLIVRPASLPLTRPLVVYGVTWFLQTVGLWVFWGMPGPAIVGALTMGSLFWFAVYRLARA